MYFAQHLYEHPVPQDWLDTMTWNQMKRMNKTSLLIIVMQTKDAVKYLLLCWQYTKVAIKLKC